MQHKKQRLFTSVLSCILVAVLVFTGCKNEAQQRSTLTINLETSTARSIEPENTPLDVTQYVLTGTGPNDTTFTNTTNKRNLSIAGLLIGDWSVHVVGKNVHGDNLMEGNGSFQLKPTPTEATITLDKLKGTGGIDLTITWNKTLIADPDFTITLIDPNGSTTTPILDKTALAEGTIKFTGSTFAAGYYRVIGHLSSGTSGIAGFAEAVRVVDGKTTTANISLNLDKASKIPAQIVLINDVGTPITCSISGITETMEVGKSATATIKADSNETINVTWYLDGLQVGTGLTYTFTPTSGEHRLDVLATGAKPTSYGSATIPFIGKVLGKAGVPVLLKQIEDGTDGLRVKGETHTSFLPDGKLLVSCPSEQTLQICQMADNGIQVIHTYSGTTDGFTLSGVSDIAVDSTRNLVFIADNTTKKMTKYSYDSTTNRLTKIIESDSKSWSSSKASGDIVKTGNICIDEGEGIVYMGTLEEEEMFCVMYDANATTQEKFRVNFGEAAFTLKNHTAGGASYTTKMFDGIVISPDDLYLSTMTKNDGLILHSSKTEQTLGLRLFGCSQQCAGITGLEGMHTMAYLTEGIVVGTADRLTVVAGGLTRNDNPGWTNYASITSGSVEAGEVTFQDVVCLKQNEERNKLYALCGTSGNILTFTCSGNDLTYLGNDTMGTFTPAELEISPDGTAMIVTSNTSNAIRYYRIPR